MMLVYPTHLWNPPYVWYLFPNLNGMVLNLNKTFGIFSKQNKNRKNRKKQKHVLHLVYDKFVSANPPLPDDNPLDLGNVCCNLTYLPIMLKISI